MRKSDKSLLTVVAIVAILLTLLYLGRHMNGLSSEKYFAGEACANELDCAPGAAESCCDQKCISGNGCPDCFTGESLVSMADGSQKRMDQVESGEWVLSGRTLEPVQVLMKLEVITEDSHLVGINGMKPFITESHPLMGVHTALLCWNLDRALQLQHWNPASIKKVEVEDSFWSQGANGLIQTPVKSIEVIPCEIDVVYNLITTDHSLIVNHVCFHDDFPEIEQHPEVSLRVFEMLLNDLSLDQACQYQPKITEFSDKLGQFFELVSHDESKLYRAQYLWEHCFETLKNASSSSSLSTESETIYQAV